jgi:hypothetical protein
MSSTPRCLFCLDILQYNREADGFQHGNIYGCAFWRIYNYVVYGSHLVVPIALTRWGHSIIPFPYLYMTCLMYDNDVCLIGHHCWKLTTNVSSV